jgi:MOB kinase activator 1
MSWIQSQIDDEQTFPSKLGIPFPKSFFETTIKTIFKRLFRVYAHIYYSHFDQILSMQAEAHLNTSFKHFISFVNEFSIIDKKELIPLAPLIASLIENKD